MVLLKIIEKAGGPRIPPVEGRAHDHGYSTWERCGSKPPRVVFWCGCGLFVRFWRRRLPFRGDHEVAEKMAELRERKERLMDEADAKRKKAAAQQMRDQAKAKRENVLKHLSTCRLGANFQNILLVCNYTNACYCKHSIFGFFFFPKSNSIKSRILRAVVIR